MTASVDVLAVIDRAAEGAGKIVKESNGDFRAVIYQDDLFKARAAVAEMVDLAKAFVDNIDEWDGEPAPGMRWHREYLAAKSLLQRVGAAA